MIPKNRIHLSRSLRAQTTPYPEAKRFIKRGLALAAVLLVVGIYLVAKPQRQEEAPPAPKQILGEQEEATAPEFIIYEVKRGDTLFNLSQTYQVSWQTLAELNNLQEPYILKIGQTLKIPGSNPR